MPIKRKCEQPACLFHTESCYCCPPSVSTDKAWKILGARYAERNAQVVNSSCGVAQICKSIYNAKRHVPPSYTAKDLYDPLHVPPTNAFNIIGMRYIERNTTIVSPVSAVATKVEARHGLPPTIYSRDKLFHTKTRKNSFIPTRGR